MDKQETKAEVRRAISDWAERNIPGNTKIKAVMGGQCTLAKRQNLAAHLNNWPKLAPCASVITRTEIECESTVAAIGLIVWFNKTKCLRDQS